jgi:hypothetical protein
MTDPGIRSPLNPVFTRLWGALHGVGIPAVLVWHGLAPWYLAAVAALELVAWLGFQRATLSENIWARLYDSDDRMIYWRAVLVLAWVVGAGLAWYLWGWSWVPVDVRAFMAVVLWPLIIVAHFLTDRYHSRLRPHG